MARGKPGPRGQWRATRTTLVAFLKMLTGAQRARLAVVFAMMVMAALLEAATLFGLKNTMGALLGEAPAAWPVLLLAALFVAKNGVLVALAFVEARVLTGLKRALSGRLFAVSQGVSLTTHRSVSGADRLRLVHEDAHAAVGQAVMPLLDGALATTMGLAIAAVLIVETPLMGLAALLLTAFAVVVVTVGLGGILRRASERRRAAIGAVMDAVADGHKNFVAAKLFGAEATLAARHDDAERAFEGAERARLTAQKVTPPITELLALLGLFVVVGSVVSASSPAEAAPVVAMVAFATLRLRQLSAKLSGAVHHVSATSANLEALTKTLCAPSEQFSDDRTRSLESQIARRFESGPVPDPMTVHGHRGSGRAPAVVQRAADLPLVFKNVSYRHPGGAVAVSGVSFEIFAGERVAIVGETGAGKSTLLALILGLLPPTSGRVTLGGVPMASARAAWWRMTGFVPQDSALLSASFEDNILFGAPRDEERLRRAVFCAELHKFAGELQTSVGEAGGRLSGGERQRVLLARALYRDPAVLVLDEATAALDGGTEGRVLSAAMAGRTVIVAAHRMASVKRADRVLVLSEGRLVAEGPFETLIRTSPDFCRISGLAA